MKDAEVAQAKISKLEAEAKYIEAEVGTAQSKQKVNEINTAIAMQRERREGIMGSIETMTRAFGMMKDNESFSGQNSKIPQMSEQQEMVLEEPMSQPV
jgi:hypothetical protein